VDAEIQAFFRELGWHALAGIAAMLLSVVLAIALKGRFAPGLAPGMGDLRGGAFLPRVLSLLGMGARPDHTLGETRLRASLGLRLLFPGALALCLWLGARMAAPFVSPLTAILLILAFQTLHVWRYEIRFDVRTVTLPRWSIGHRSFAWTDLEALTDRDPWFLTFHFRGGRRVTAHKYVVGHRLLREAAQKALREV